MEKSTVYFTDFRCPVGTSQLDKLKKLCIAAGIKDIDMDGKFVAIKMHFGELGKMECHRKLHHSQVRSQMSPGLPLKIVFPHLKVTLLDSLNKRIDFLNAVIEKTGLTGIETIHGRAEDFAKPGLKREIYDLCVSRAVANLATLSEYCLPYVKIGGEFIPYKSGEVADELQDAKSAVFLLGGKVESCENFDLPGSDIHRSLVRIKKVGGCPKKYPRKAGMPSKVPLHT